MTIPEITAAQAAEQISHGDYIAVGGFGPAGSPKVIPPALAAKARREHEQGRAFQVNIVTGASIGSSCDGELAAARAVDRRLPFSVNADMRRAYNAGEVRYTDLNLSDNASHLRQGITGPITFGIIEAVDVQEVRGRLLLRPSEISNCPEIIARLGICSINTALEVDIYGHVNSTKVGGTHMMNGVGGSCDFTCNAMLASFTCASTAKDGRISSIVPFCSHIDHTEHYVDAIVTEYGVADLRNKCAAERAEALIAIAHPDYRPLLREYLRLAAPGGGHTHHILPAAFAMHDTYRRKGDMRLTDWSEYILD